MSKYYRVCTKLNDIGTFVKEGQNLDKYKDSEAYVSVFKYSEEQKKQFEEKKTVTGINDVVTDILYFDFDGDDLEEVRKDTLTVVERLQKYGAKNINICFSGRKGFHLALHTTTTFSPTEAKTLATNIAGDLASFDSVIYNANRIIRVEGSVHTGTGLRKTRISEKELKESSIADLKALSKERYEYTKPSKETLTGAILELKEPKKKEKKEDELTITTGVDYNSNPYKLQPWKLALSQGFFPSGNRSNSLMILASTLVNKKLNKTQCYYALKAAADLQADRYGEDRFSKGEIWTNIIEQVYKDSWQGGTYSEDNFPTQLQNYFEGLGIPRQEYSKVANSVSRLDDEFDSFMNYAETINENTMETGITELDTALKLRKGHLIGLIAPPGAGKTSFAITLLKNTSNKGTNSYFGCYDMYKHNITSKLIVRETGDSEDNMFQAFIDKDAKKIKTYRDALKNYSNVSFCFKSGQTIKDLKKSIDMEEEKQGKAIDLVIIDYLELIQTDKSDPTISSAEAIQGLREVANDGRVVVVLLQPNKMSSKINMPMMSYNAAKGSSSIAQACTAILGCWREGVSPDTPENDNYFSINILKNRNGPLASLDFSWDGKTQKIGSLSAEDKFRLSVLRDTKNDADSEDY